MSNKSNKPILVVLAAGMGSRYGGLKQMDAFGPNGETILDYSIYDAIQAGFGKVVFIIRESFDTDFRAFFANKFEDQIEVAYVFQDIADVPEGFDIPEERSKPWGTAHAVWAARNEVNGPFAVINADDFYGRGAYEECMNFFQNGSENAYGLIGYELDNTLSKHGTVNRGVCTVDSKDLLTGVVETLKIGYDKEGKIQYPKAEGVGYLEAKTPVSMNLWTFYPDYFDYCGKMFDQFLKDHGKEEKSEFFIPLLVENLITSGEKRVEVLTCDEEWFGVTYQEDKPVVIAKLNKLVTEGRYPANLWSKTC